MPLDFGPAFSEDDAEEFDFNESRPLLSIADRRRRQRFNRFVACELVILVVLLISTFLGMGHRAFNDPLAIGVRIITLVSAVCAAVIPILFYGLPEMLPRGDE